MENDCQVQDFYKRLYDGLASVGQYYRVLKRKSAIGSVVDRRCRAVTTIDVQVV